MPEFLSWLEPLTIIRAVGLVGVIAVIFAESGLFFGFFLPGDSLLFTAGLLASQGHLPIGWLLLGCFAAAVLGDSVGYAFGKKIGPRIFSREDSFFFKKSHLERTRDFYAKYGRKTIVLARFVPVVRTFAPILAGVGTMPYREFLRFNLIGACLWALGMTLLGFFLGTLVPGIEDYILYIVIAIILTSFIPVFAHLRRR